MQWRKNMQLIDANVKKNAAKNLLRRSFICFFNQSSKLIALRLYSCSQS